jgi:hypothetical protein
MESHSFFHMASWKATLFTMGTIKEKKDSNKIQRLVTNAMLEKKN